MSWAGWTTWSSRPRNAHDLGHPPFGHLGERVLDKLARSGSGCRTGSRGTPRPSGSSPSSRCTGPGDEGLNLTAATGPPLKYPWARYVVPDSRTPPGGPSRPGARGLRPGGSGAGSSPTYDVDLPEMLAALSAFPDLPPGRQTLECSVMDLADDIAYPETSGN